MNLPNSDSMTVKLLTLIERLLGHGFSNDAPQWPGGPASKSARR
jgi:hypothetical protein